MKKLLLTTALVALSSQALAGEKGPTVTLGGMVDTQFGYRQQKTAYRNDANGNQLNKGGIVNDTKINVKVDGQSHGLKYGGLVVLNADASKNKYGNSNIGYQTMVYVDSRFGRAEAGAYTGVVDSMSVSAASIARATGGIKGDARYWWNPSLATNVGTSVFTYGAGLPASYIGKVTTVADEFFVTPSLVSNMDTGNTANATKINLYSAKYYGFKVGLTYIPDTEQTGTVSNFTGLTKKASTGFNPNPFAFRDVFSGGISFDHKFNEVQVKASVLGEFGKAKDFPGATAAAKNNLQRENLRSWEVGGSLGYKGFAVAASYGDLSKSGLFKTVPNGVGKRKSNYWTVGAAYDYHQFGASVTYMQSKRGGIEKTQTQFKNLSFGVDYRVAPGFMPYAEVSSFKLDTKIANAPKNTGNIFLGGVKVSF